MFLLKNRSLKSKDRPKLISWPPSVLNYNELDIVTLIYHLIKRIIIGKNTDFFL